LSKHSTIVKEVKPFADFNYCGILFSLRVEFCGLFAYGSYVFLEFGNGAKIVDEFGHLEGSGKLRRNIKIVNTADVETEKPTAYLLLSLEAAER
jgi:hypothetical protein